MLTKISFIKEGREPFDVAPNAGSFMADDSPYGFIEAPSPIADKQVAEGG